MHSVFEVRQFVHILLGIAALSPAQSHISYEPFALSAKRVPTFDYVKSHAYSVASLGPSEYETHSSSCDKYHRRHEAFVS